QIRLESDADLVQVVTVHKSKGLEYPLVFLPFGCSARDRDGKKLPVVWHDEAGALQLSLVEHAHGRARAEHERRAECVRKLYVALTRARHATWVGVAPFDTLKASALGHVLGEVDGAELPARLDELRANCEHIAVALAPEPDYVRLSEAAAAM